MLLSGVTVVRRLLFQGLVRVVLAKLLTGFLSEESGQTATEYMLVISVVAIATVGSAYTFVPRFETGVNELGQDIYRALDTGQLDRAGTAGPNGQVQPPANQQFRGLQGQPQLNSTAPDESWLQRQLDRIGKIS